MTKLICNTLSYDIPTYIDLEHPIKGWVHYVNLSQDYFATASSQYPFHGSSVQMKDDLN